MDDRHMGSADGLNEKAILDVGQVRPAKCLCKLSWGGGLRSGLYIYTAEFR